MFGPLLWVLTYDNVLTLRSLSLKDEIISYADGFNFTGPIGEEFQRKAN